MENTLKQAQELAHDMVTNAAAPVRAIRDMAKEMGVTEKDVERYVSKLAYRKAYNERPEVKEKRKLYNAERAQTEKIIKTRIQASGRTEMLNRLAAAIVKG